MGDDGATGEGPGQDCTVTVRAGGPYWVQGPVSLVRRRSVMSEHGEPLTWQTTVRLPTAGDYALCRCGGSATKPFCDGTHASNGFAADDTAPDVPYDEQARPYELTGVVMRDDRSLCVHAGFCGNRLTNVWKMARADAAADSVARAQLMTMIERCPSGALTYRLATEGDDVEPELPAQAAVIDDGPIFLSGRVPVTLDDGTRLEVRNRMTLCRCGASESKPLCDGSHKKTEFRDSSITTGQPESGGAR